MAKVELKGMSQYLKQLENVSWATAEVCQAAVYAGADVVADEIRKGIDRLKANPDAYSLAAYQKLMPTYINVTQKRGLQESLGIAKISGKYGVYSTKIGFDGYNDIKTDRWPQGQPNQLIARACESGSEAMYKQPFMRPAISRAKNEALSKMAQAVDKKLKEITGGE